MKLNFMKKLKTIIGILLIVLSIAGMFFWEVRGREVVMMDEVLVANQEIQGGETIADDMFTVKRIPKSLLLEHVLKPKDLPSLNGKVSAQRIAKNDQIVPIYFDVDSFRMDQNQSLFVIRPEWISMRSSALRRGDIVDIYEEANGDILGTFHVAYVKDEADREVKNAGAETMIKGDGGILERTDSTSMIDHIEIISTLEQYEKIRNRVNGFTGVSAGALLIVQKGEQPNRKELNL